jgi:trans-2-enoyl-CoA reductase
LTTTRNIIIAVFVLGAVAGQVLVARRNTQTLKTIAKRTGVKFEKPPKSKNDDDWF